MRESQRKAIKKYASTEKGKEANKKAQRKIKAKKRNSSIIFLEPKNYISSRGNVSNPYVVFFTSNGFVWRKDSVTNKRTRLRSAKNPAEFMTVEEAKSIFGS